MGICLYPSVVLYRIGSGLQVMLCDMAQSGWANDAGASFLEKEWIVQLKAVLQIMNDYEALVDFWIFCIQKEECETFCTGFEEKHFRIRFLAQKLFSCISFWEFAVNRTAQMKVGRQVLKTCREYCNACLLFIDHGMRALRSVAEDNYAMAKIGQLEKNIRNYLVSYQVSE